MTSDAWKYSETENGIIYNLQIADIPWKFKKALSEAMQDWEIRAYGWNIKSGGQILIYSNLFKSEDDWTKWATAFALEVKEKRYWGSKVTTIIHKKAGK
jgi:hypothetical protein